MILKIKKRNLVIVSFILIFLVPVVYAVVGVKEAGFGVELWIGNVGPVMVFDPGTSYTLAGTDPSAGQSVLVWFVFNVTDDNGADDIEEALTRFNLTLGTPGFAQWRFNSTCTNISKDEGLKMVRFNCSVYMQYFDNASNDWVLNATATDGSAQAINDTRTFVYNELSGMNIPVAWMNFTGPTIGASNYPTGGINITLNNTGNDDFEQINITAADLIGADLTVFGIGNFTANFSNAVDGGFALNGTGQTFLMQDGTKLLLAHGHTSASTDYNDGVIADKGNQSLFFWVNVPSSGLTAQKYNNTWNITVIDLTP